MESHQNPAALPDQASSLLEPKSGAARGSRLADAWPDLLLGLVTALLPLLFLWRLLALKPEDRLGIVEGDFTEQYFPLRAFTAREWANGRVPLWNPSIFGGQPALADPQAGALYPPHVLQALVLGWAGIGFPVWALEQQVLWHLAWAGIGAYLLGRYWGLKTGASLKAARLMGLILALTFTYSGYMTSFPVQQISILQVSAWLPWVMWTLSRALDAGLSGSLAGSGGNLAWGNLFERGFVRRAARGVAWTGLTFALAILAGHPQTVMYIFYLTLAYTIFVALRQSAHNRLTPALAVSRAVTMWALSLGLGGLIAAAQLWPTLEFIRHSLRADLSFEAVSPGLPLSELVSILYPGYFGGSPEYVGILPLVLIGVAVVLAPTRLRSTIYFWLGLGLVALLLAFGANTFLYPLFYLLVPGFDTVRQQERVFMLYSFAAATLAGYGALLLVRPVAHDRKQVWRQFQRNLAYIGGAAVALSGLFVYGATLATERGDEVNLFFGVLRHHIFGLIILGGTLLLLALRPRRIWRRSWGIGLAALWLIFNLFSVNWRFNLAPRAEPPLFTPLEVSQFLIDHTAELPQPVRIASGGLLRGGHNAAAVYGLEDITGNEPLQLANVAAFADFMPAWRLWQLLNVRYVVDERDIDSEGLARRYEAGGRKVFEVTDPFPRVRIVHQVISTADLNLLTQAEIDLKTTAIVPAGVALAISGDDEGSSVVVIEAHPGFLRVAVDAKTEGLLVVSNIDYPGWQAAVDGAAATLYRTNGIFQGVVVPAGQHEVTLRFWPDSFRWGSWLSLGGLGLAFSLFWVGRLDQRP